MGIQDKILKVLLSTSDEAIFSAVISFVVSVLGEIIDGEHVKN